MAAKKQREQGLAAKAREALEITDSRRMGQYLVALKVLWQGFETDRIYFPLK